MYVNIPPAAAGRSRRRRRRGRGRRRRRHDDKRRRTSVPLFVWEGGQHLLAMLNSSRFCDNRHPLMLQNLNVLFQN